MAGFEEPRISSWYLQANASQTTFPGWTAVSGSVDIVEEDTNQVLDLDGSTPGTISSIAWLNCRTAREVFRTCGLSGQLGPLA